MGEASRGGIDRGVLILLAVPLAILVARSPLGASLWLDECVTAWVSRDGVAEASARAAAFQGQSPLYFVLISLWSRIAGTGEVALRAPSIAFVLLTAGFVWALGRRYAGGCGAILAAGVFLLHDGVLLAAFSARPYALALAAATASVYCFERMLDGERTARWGGAYVVATLLAFYAHYLFLPVLGVHVVTFLRRERPVPVGAAIASWGAVLAGLVPGFIQLRSLFERRESLGFAAQATVAQLARGFVPAPLLLYIGCSVVVGLVLFYPKGIRRAEGRLPVPWVMLSAWLAAPVVLFFLASRFGGIGLFVGRYWVWQAPAAALLTGALFELVERGKARNTAVAVIAILAAFFELGRVWQIEDWRGAAAEVRSGPELPVFLYTGLIEAERADWLDDPARAEYLRAPFEYYGVPNRPIVVVPSGGPAAGEIGVAGEAAWFVANQMVRPAPNPGSPEAEAGRHPRGYAHEAILEALGSAGYDSSDELMPLRGQLVRVRRLKKGSIDAGLH